MNRAEGVDLTLALADRIAPLLAGRVEGLAEWTPADLTFGNLWLFRREHRWRWHDDAWPYLSGLTYDRQHVALPLFDLRDAPRDTVHALLERHEAIFPLCSREAEAARAAGFRLADHRNDADYVYRAAAFRDLRGRGLKKKANLIGQLLQRHTVAAEPYGVHLHGAALEVLDGWLVDRNRAPGDADDQACRDALALFPELRLQGYLYRADGVPAGFLLAEPLQHGVWAIRFAKGLTRFKGIAQYMFHHFASRGGPAAGSTVDWLNFEQDLGIANFRLTKMSYRPARLLPKWRLLPPTTSRKTEAEERT